MFARSTVLFCVSSSLLLLSFTDTATAQRNGDLRLAQFSGSNSFSTAGRLEIFINGQWGTVCDHFFSSTDANVACRQLGYSSGTTSSITFYGSGSGPIWLDDVGCTGSESCLLSCSNRGIGSNNCFHSDDVAISCFGTRFASTDCSTAGSTDAPPTVSGPSAVNIVGIAVGVTVGVIVLFVVVPILICVVCFCCVAGGAAASSRRPRTVVTTTPAPAATTATGSQQAAYPQTTTYPESYPQSYPAAGTEAPPPPYSAQLTEMSTYPPEPQAAYPAPTAPYPPQPQDPYPPQDAYPPQGGYPPYPPQGGYPPYPPEGGYPPQ